MEPNLEDGKKSIALTQQFLKSLGYENRKVNLNTSFEYHLGLGSLARFELLRRLKKEFNVELDDQLMMEVDNISDFFAKATSKTISTQQTMRSVKHKHEKSYKIPTQAKTIIDVLTFHAAQNPQREHVFFQDENGKEIIITYGELLDSSLRIAQSLLDLGLSPGSRIAFMIPNHPDFLYTFLGILIANCVPVPIYPPFQSHLIKSYAVQAAKILQNTGVSLLVSSHKPSKLSRLLQTYTRGLEQIVTPEKLLNNKNKAPIPELKTDDFALLQYTSSNLRTPKGVLLTHQNLLANIRATGKAIGITQEDIVVSWIPLYHALGLIDMWLGSFYHDIPLILMTPLTFLNRPEQWLWAIHYHNATISAGPDFAYELCVKKLENVLLEGLDLSSWRLAINSDEMIQPTTLVDFHKRFATYGFKYENFIPAYSLTEAAGCLTISPQQGPYIDRIEAFAFKKAGRAIKTNDVNHNSQEFVSCGNPISQHEVRIVDYKGNIVPDRHVGNLQFKGPAAMQGYYGNSKATNAIHHDGWWDSGDLAYLDNNEIFITNQKKDIPLNQKFTRKLFSIKPSKIKLFLAKIIHSFGNILKLIYSTYVFLTVALTYTPVYLSLWIFPRKFCARLCHYWAKLLFILILCPIKITNKKNLYKLKRVIFVANHSSYIDVLVFFAVLPPDAKIVGKKELTKTLVLRKMITKLKHIMIGRSDLDKEALDETEKVEKAINEENLVLIFPEGTFSYAAGLRPFKLGAFKIAADLDMPLLPIAVKGTRKVLRDGDFLPKPGLISITVGEPIFPKENNWEEIARLRDESRKHILQYCGESSLDFIPAGRSVADLKRPEK